MKEAVLKSEALALELPDDAAKAPAEDGEGAPGAGDAAPGTPGGETKDQ
jgi:hypothetical protein